MVKVLKIICLALLTMLTLLSTGFAEGKTDQKEFDYHAEYTGEIVRSDKNFIVVNIVDTDIYVGIRVLDKQGFIVDGDLIRGQLINLAKWHMDMIRGRIYAHGGTSDTSLAGCSGTFNIRKQKSTLRILQSAFSMA